MEDDVLSELEKEISANMEIALAAQRRFLEEMVIKFTAICEFCIEGIGLSFNQAVEAIRRLGEGAPPDPVSSKTLNRGNLPHPGGWRGEDSSPTLPSPSLRDGEGKRNMVGKRAKNKAFNRRWHGEVPVLSDEKPEVYGSRQKKNKNNFKRSSKWKLTSI